MSQAILELAHLAKRYGQGANRREVLRDVNLKIEPGDSVAVCGPSGCGKSTLLNLIAALDRADGGSVILENMELAQRSDRELAEIRNRQIGMIFQLHHLLPQCSVRQNVLIPTLAGFTKDDDKERRADELLEQVGLAEKRHQKPAELSGGERQRTAVARALINQPNLLLADEPTGSLDTETAGHLADLLMTLNRERKTTLLVVTHSTRLAKRMNRRFDLRDGVLHPSDAGDV